MYRHGYTSSMHPSQGIQTQNVHMPQSHSMHPQINVPQQSNVSSNVTPVILDTNAAISLSMGHTMYYERALMARNDIWHRILVLRGGQYDKEVILRSVLRAISPADLIPVNYQVIGEDACFMARNCDKALDQLCKKSLFVTCLDGTPLVLSITLGFASIHDLKINIQPLLLAALKARFDPVKKLLDLKEFHKDSGVYDTVYCPLSQNKTLIHVLKLSKTALGIFDTINLQSNELTSLALIESTNLKTLKCLDLRYNEFVKIEQLEPLNSINISELYLDGNPLCDNYSSASQYVEAVRQYCPYIIKLDGVQVNAPGQPFIFKSYIKNSQRKSLIEQFVEHFFRAYDYRDRSVLRGLYHRNAWYSTTVGNPTSPVSRRALEPFGPENRNLLIFGKNSQQLLHQGQDEILKVFKQLPPSQHIHRSFCCDLMFDNGNMLVISVEGLFKSMNALNQLFSFNRTFVIVEDAINEFKILNDQYHVNPPIPVAEHEKYNLEKEEVPEYEPTCFSPEEKQNLLQTFHQTTTMELESCENYLKEANWSMKKALTKFLNDHKSGKFCSWTVTNWKDVK